MFCKVALLPGAGLGSIGPGALVPFCPWDAEQLACHPDRKDIVRCRLYRSGAAGMRSNGSMRYWMGRDIHGGHMQGFYINLDSQPERRARIEQQIFTHGLAGRMTRVAAMEGGASRADRAKVTPGEVGCFHSHLAALKLARAADGQAMIIEDDAMLSAAYTTFALHSFTTKIFDTFDIVFTDVILQPELAVLHYLKRALEDALSLRERNNVFMPRVLDISRRTFSAAASYLVAPRALDKLIRILEEECAVGPRMPFDLFLRAAAKQGLFRVACVAPFLTSVYLEDVGATTIENRERHAGNPTVLAAALLRYAFFIDSDIDGYARPFLDRIPWPHPTPCGDTRFDMVMKLIAFMLSDKYASF